MIIFKLIGALLTLSSAAVIAAKYSEHLSERAAVVRGFCELLLHIKTRISVYLLPPSELTVGFHSEALERAGFLSLCRECGTPAEAYFKMKKHLPVSKEAARALDGYFSAFGTTYKDELLRLSDATYALLLCECERLDTELPREKKLSRTVILAIALGAVILFI